MDGIEVASGDSSESAGLSLDSFENVRTSVPRQERCLTVEQDGLTGPRVAMPDLSREGSLANAISQTTSFTRRFSAGELDAGVLEDAIFQRHNEDPATP